MHRITGCVHGRVQGVSFRYYTRKEAQRLGLTGWVRNEADGSVLVVADGPEDSLSTLLEYLHLGPASARVDKVEVSWSKTNHGFDKFEIRWL